MISLQSQSGFHLGFLFGGEERPLIDHTHFVCTLYWHVICTTLASSPGSIDSSKSSNKRGSGDEASTTLGLMAAKMMCTQWKEKKKLAFMNCFGGED